MGLPFELRTCVLAPALAALGMAAALGAASCGPSSAGTTAFPAPEGGPPPERYLAEAAVEGLECPPPVSLDAAGATCPAFAPSNGSCCPAPGLTCTYPGNETAFVLATCSEESGWGTNPGTYWGIRTVLDRNVCEAPLDSGVDFTPDGGQACADRPVLPCTVKGPDDSPQIELNTQLTALAAGCAVNPPPVELDFEGGCATRLFVDVNAAFADTQVLECLAPQVFALQFACARGLACARVTPEEVCP